MKMIDKSLLTVTAIMLVFFVVYSPINIYADTGAPTSTGDLRVSSNDDVLYVTTAGASNFTENSASVVKDETNRGSNILGKNIVIPRAYAKSIGELITGLLPIILVFSILLAFFYFILAGLQWITSGGDKSKTEEARNKIVHAFIGVIIVASTFALANFVAYILGFESLNNALLSLETIKLS